MAFASQEFGKDRNSEQKEQSRPLADEAAARERINAGIFSLTESKLELYLKNLLEREPEALTLVKALISKPRDDFSLVAYGDAPDGPEEPVPEELVRNEQSGLLTMRLGNVLLKQGRLQSAVLAYKTAEKYLSASHDHENLAATRSNLITGLIKLAYEDLKANQLHEAWNHAQEALRYLRPLLQNSSEDLENLADIHNIMCIVSHQWKKLDEALLYGQVEHALLLQVSDRTNTKDPQLDIVKENLLKILIDLIEQQLACDEVQKAAQTCLALYKIHNELDSPIFSDGSLRKFAGLAASCAHQFLIRRQLDKARDLFLLTINLRLTLRAPLPGDQRLITNARRCIGLTAAAEARQLQDQLKFDRAITVCHQALNDGPDRIQPKTSADYLSQVGLLRRLSLCYRQLREFKKAALCHETALQALSKLPVAEAIPFAPLIKQMQAGLAHCYFNHVLQVLEQRPFEKAIHDALAATRVPSLHLFLPARQKEHLLLRQAALNQLVDSLQKQAESHHRAGSFEEALYVSLTANLIASRNKHNHPQKHRAQLELLSQQFYTIFDQLISLSHVHLIGKEIEKLHAASQLATSLLEFIKQNSYPDTPLLQNLGSRQLLLAQTLQKAGTLLKASPVKLNPAVRSTTLPLLSGLACRFSPSPSLKSQPEELALRPKCVPF